MRLTLTGIDERVPVEWMRSVLDRVRKDGIINLEFGILRSPKAGQSPRFPERKVVELFSRYIYPHSLAYHLCGGYARQVHAGEWTELREAIDFSLVDRVQINSVEASPGAMLGLMRFGIWAGKEIIMQWRGDEFPAVPRLSLLQDRSGGRGIAETSWAVPDALCRKDRETTIGFAGGLGPDNVAAALNDIAVAASAKPFWIDCESRLRTDDWFDVEKAEAMINAVTEWRRGKLRAAAR